MAMITSASLTALRIGLQKHFNDAFTAADAASFWREVATLVPSTTAGETYGWLGDFPDLREWIGARVVKDMKESAYTIANKTWESTVGIGRDQFEDDNLGIYTPMVQSMGQSAGRHPDVLMAGLMKGGDASLCYDGQYFFDTDHPVYPNVDGTGVAAVVSNHQGGAGTPWYLLDCSRPLKPFIFQQRRKAEFEAKQDPSTSDNVFNLNRFDFGASARHNVGFGLWQCGFLSKQTLNQVNFDAAFAAMMGFKADGGRPLGIMPTHLVVPPALRSDANATIEAMLTANGGSNTNYKAVKVIVSPWLA